ncbi:type 1 glutamine amidotransferase [Iamia sp. SCSIO 61187]|uniref:type 1 glutamine amidotransferase domain-containing protein n=1 Tax=Iamia sp. SCSIO 61187 TaxID=2722752 RepID=UPI001C63A5E0|nr:type 1 glutamine amidotransferase domain-containing protein [Iamia sp. SCSIO 61187]QYG93388.1 type 1 glutamine amidotransferase [Iamia sp. SCSIO 61187]
MAADLSGKKVAFVVANEGVEQVELTEPWKAVEQAGATPVLVATEAGEVQAFDHLDKADTFPVDLTTADAQASDYAALVLPGGVANPDQLRTDAEAQRLVRAAADAGLPIAVICHGPWTLIDADVVDGRRVTSWPSLRTDLVNAGATWVDEEVVVDEDGAGPLITSRNPDDLPAFTKALVDALS